MTRRIRLVGGLVLLAVPFLAGCGSEQAPGAEPAEQGSSEVVREAVPVRVRTLAAQTVHDVVSLPADLLPLRRAVLAAEVDGVVEALHVEVGQAVRRGHVLAQVDTRALQQALAEAEALHRQAAAQFERAENLFERRSITKQQMLDAVTNRDVAEARLASARLRLSKSRLDAPWTGQIAAKRIEVGDYVVPGQPMLELLDAARLKVRAPAPATDVLYLQVGATVSIRVQAGTSHKSGDDVVEGNIIRLGAELDPQARTLDVEAEIDNADGRLRPGMLAWLQVERQTLEDVVLVPLDAVIDLGTAKAVYVVDGTVEEGESIARRREVELGPVLGEQVVVLEGLAPGARLIVEGQQQVGDGEAVHIVPAS